MLLETLFIGILWIFCCCLGRTIRLGSNESQFNHSSLLNKTVVFLSSTTAEVLGLCYYISYGPTEAAASLSVAFWQQIISDNCWQLPLVTEATVPAHVSDWNTINPFHGRQK